MTNEERYYRRSYFLLKRLTETYKNGFNKSKSMEFYRNELLNYIENPMISSEQQDSLILTIMIALLGLNKETIEKKEKITEYKNSNLIKDLSELDLNEETQRSITEFKKLKNKNSAFNNWLSIIKSPDSDLKNSDIIRRVRNGLLHSNFEMKKNNLQTSFTRIKTKSYYESEIFNQNFYQFVLVHFSNVIGVGLTDEDIILDAIKMELKNSKDLKEYLEKITIIKIESSILDYDGKNTVGMQIIDSLSKNKKVINLNKIKKKFNQNFGENVNIKSIDNYCLVENTINNIINRIENEYKDFYNLSNDEKFSIINSTIGYTLNSKAEISNWLLHFYQLINNLCNKNFDINDDFFDGDEYAKESCSISLSIIKTYLILYRLQNINYGNNENKFNELNYKNIDFNFESEDFYIWLENDEGDEINNYKIFDLGENNNSCLSEEETKKKILCDIIRNSLAHGNINSFYSVREGQTIIELKDVNPKDKNKVRCIQMTIKKFNDFLDSEAFLPKNCYSKENEISVTKNK